MSRRDFTTIPAIGMADRRDFADSFALGGNCCGVETMIDEVALGRYLRRMRSVGINLLNSRLSEYVRLAASGETILVTDRDRMVAEPGSLRETRSPILADAFPAYAVRSGVLTLPAPAGSGPPPKPAPVARLDEVLAELDENRRDR